MNENAPPTTDTQRVLDHLQTLTNTVQQNQVNNEASLWTLMNTVQQNEASLRTLTNNVQHLANNFLHLTNTVQQNEASLRTLTNKVDLLTNTVDKLDVHVLETSFPLFNQAGLVGSCVIDSDKHAVLTTEKCGVYTWVRVEEKLYVVGAVHCALAMLTIGVEIDNLAIVSNLTFVELPESILLKKEVLNVRLLHPYDELITNPLPAEFDVILIEVVEGGIDQEFSVDITAAQVEVLVDAEDDVTTLVAGRAHGSVVTNKGGLVVKVPGKVAGTGTLEFAIQSAEPGDSGTLLHTKTLNGGWKPMAVFRGKKPAYHKEATPRGIGTLIPSVAKFDTLDVVDIFQENPNAKTFIYHGNEGGPENLEWKVESIGDKNAVKLVSRGEGPGRCKYGVFVRSKKPIEFTGQTEWDSLYGRRHGFFS
jgi:hypothetical protein